MLARHKRATRSRRVGRQVLRLVPAGHGLLLWVALRAQPAARPARIDPGQLGMGVRHYVFAAR